MSKIPLCLRCDHFLRKIHDDHNPLGKFALWGCMKCGQPYPVYDKRPTGGRNMNFEMDDLPCIVIPDGLMLESGEPYPVKERSEQK